MTPPAEHANTARWDDQRQRYVTDRGFQLFGCAKRRCDAVNPDFEAFGARGRSWCLHHIPLLTRLRMRGRLYD